MSKTSEKMTKEQLFKWDYVQRNRLDEKVLFHCLKKLTSKGNMYAYDCLVGTDKDMSDELLQEVRLAICEGLQKGTFEVWVNNQEFYPFRTEIRFNVNKEIWQSVSNYLYNQRQKVAKKMSVCDVLTDEKCIELFDSKALSQFVDKEKLLYANIDLFQFMKKELKTRDIQVLGMLVDGYSQTDISKELILSRQMVRTSILHIRNTYENYRQKVQNTSQYKQRKSAFR